MMHIMVKTSPEVLEYMSLFFLWVRIKSMVGVGLCAWCANIDSIDTTILFNSRLPAIVMSPGVRLNHT